MEYEHLCGLCGNLAGDLLTAQQCWPATPQSAARSFRLSANCSTPVAEQFREEECASNQERIPSGSAGSLVIPYQVTECLRSRHALVRLGQDQVCLSQLPVAECGEQRHGCVTRAVVTKLVDFTCLTQPDRHRTAADATARSYVERAARGEVLTELRDDTQYRRCHLA